MSPPLQNAANLRLPVPFFDLLMVLLVTCLVFVSPVRSDTELEALDVSVSRGKSASAPGALLPVTATRAGESWVFHVAGDPRQDLTPGDLARRATSEGRKIALIVPPATAVQDFVDMQMALSSMGVPFALAIKNKENAP
jgi:hypothetical protein